LGSEWNASNKKEMLKLGITSILNVAEECPVKIIYNLELLS
jgi:hypothetical protein